MTRRRGFLLEVITLMAAVGLAHVPQGSVAAQAEILPKPVPVRPIGPDPDPGRHVSVASKPPAGLSHHSELERLITRLDPAQLRPLEPDSWEAEVLAAAKKSVRQILQLKLEDPNGPMLFTLPTEDGDTLVARWNVTDSTRPERTIWLWDTPFETTFVTEVDPGVLRADELTRYCEGLFVWYKVPLILKSLALTYLNSQAGKEEVSGMGEYVETQRGNYYMHFTALAGEGRSYVRVSVSKPFMVPDCPAEACEVPERFPPLRTRLAGVSREALFEEQGKGCLAHCYLTYPVNRDAIILRELVSRGPLSDAEVRRVVTGNFDKGDYHSGEIVGYRLSAFLRALNDQNALEAYAPALEAVLLGAPVHSLAEDNLAAMVFSAMKKRGMDSSHAACAFLERGRYVGYSLFYLGHDAAPSEEMLQKLESIAVDPRYESSKQGTISQIKDRLRSMPRRGTVIQPPRLR
jgi:hypothetical protein